MRSILEASSSYRRLGSRRVYVRKGAEKSLAGLSKLIFDCDGVLASDVESYRENVRRVVDYYFLKLLGLEGRRRRLVTHPDIQRFKDTGLFNNDWNLSYALITYYLALLIRVLQMKNLLDEFADKFWGASFSGLEAFTETLGSVGSWVRQRGIGIETLVKMRNQSGFSLKSMLDLSLLTGSTSPERILQHIVPVSSRGDIESIKRMVPYGDVAEDLLKRLFEESYLGGRLFRKLYGLNPFFRFRRGLIETESFIPKRSTLNSLKSRFGKFAVYSERPRNQGLYLLDREGVRSYFDDEALVFFEDMLGLLGLSSPVGEDVPVGKPNPEPFILLARKFVGSADATYVGDTVSDAMLVENARLKGLANILFIGLLGPLGGSKELLETYINCDAEAIIESVNDIPYLMKRLED